MITIALPNNGKLNAANLLALDGKGTVQGPSFGSGDAASGGDTLPFPMIFAKMVNTASQLKGNASSFDEQNANSRGYVASGADMTGEQKTPLFMLKIKVHPAGQEKKEKLSNVIEGNLISLSEDGTAQTGEDALVLELNLQDLLEALQDSKTTLENPSGADESGEAASILSSFLQAVISTPQNQGGSVGVAQDAGIATSGRELIPAVMQGGAEMARSVIDKLISMGENISSEETDKGNKILLALPQDLLKGFVINKNGQPHLAQNGFVVGETSAAVFDERQATPAGQPFSPEEIHLNQRAVSVLRLPVISVSGEAPVITMHKEMGENDPARGPESLKLYLALSTDGTEPTVQLVRLNTQASTSSPQGALLAAALGLQKTNQPNPAVPDADNASAESEPTLPVNPFQHETLVKSPGERSVREMLLNQAPAPAGDKVNTPVGTDPKQGAFPQSLESSKPDPISVAKGVEGVKDASLVREDSAKGILIVSGKESGQGVPYAGASSPQFPLGTETTPKGVFIPMDRLINEAGAVLGKGAGKVQMTLQPPSLGTINMEVIVQNNRVELVLTANHADVQQLLQANSDQLKSALNNQGFQVDQMSVLLRRENFGFNLGGNLLWQDGSGRQPSNGDGSSSPPSTSEPEAVIPRDYGTGTISIFA